MAIGKVILLLLLLTFKQGLPQDLFREKDMDNLVMVERDRAIKKYPAPAVETGTNYDVKWYGCLWQVDPAQRFIYGEVTTLFQAAGAPLDSMILDLHRNLVVTSVMMHGQHVVSKHAEDLLTIYFPESVPASALDSVKVIYQGVPPEDGWGSFTQSSHNDVPILWTLSEPYGAHTWWPCKDGLTDKADSIDIFIRAKVPFSSASNGVLEDVTYGSDYTTFHWKHRYPIVPYLVCFSVTNYLEYSQNIQSGGKSLAFTNYVYPEDSATAMSQTGAVVSMIQLFDSLFGPYPYQYEKYGQAQFGWGGGMEHQTITFLGGFGFELMAHELAHQWFGDKVTCGSWSDIWLNEGFATYLSGLVYEFIQPIYWKRFREVRVQSIVSEPDGSVFCDDTTRIERIFDGRLSYAKGGMILHQLRWILGDSVFFTALRNYIDDPDLAFGFVRNSDLKAHLESACLCNLTGYFNDWYTGQGYPSYTVNWKQTGNEVNLTLLQTQSHPSVSFFELPVPILLKSSTRDTIVRLNNTFSGESFRINLPFSVDSVFIDPDYQLITANNVVYGIHELPGLPSSRVFPVPADDLVTIETSSFPPNANVSLVLFSSLGTPVLNLPGRTTDNNIVLNISFLPPGIYFYSVTCGSDRIHGKIIIQH